MNGRQRKRPRRFLNTDHVLRVPNTAKATKLSLAYFLSATADAARAS